MKNTIIFKDYKEVINSTHYRRGGNGVCEEVAKKHLDYMKNNETNEK